ncbi:hypothetical protein HPB47_006615 [Ixodes persulcatus]|uniref:Uncharacterized protein n=1 Tax=Ixodes persulcatus TaxID=34615 RepID=A0AC60P9T3_IXOPE|nr:hypothetical protein HPB47_006615 [Ixodes persulcatus]
MEKRTQYDATFKKKAILVSEDVGNSCAALCLGVNESLIWGWRKNCDRIFRAAPTRKAFYEPKSSHYPDLENRGQFLPVNAETIQLKARELAREAGLSRDTSKASRSWELSVVWRGSPAGGRRGATSHCAARRPVAQRVARLNWRTLQSEHHHRSYSSRPALPLKVDWRSRQDSADFLRRFARRTPRRQLMKTEAIACCVVCGGRSDIQARGSVSQGLKTGGRKQHKGAIGTPRGTVMARQDPRSQRRAALWVQTVMRTQVANSKLRERPTRQETGKMGDLAKELRAALTPMPDSEALVPAWFKSTKNMMFNCGTPEEVRGAIILPFLNIKMRAMVADRANGKVLSFVELRELVLTELKFRKTRKEHMESWSQVSTQLDILFGYYLESQGVKGVGEFRKSRVKGAPENRWLRNLNAHLIRRQMGKDFQSDQIEAKQTSPPKLTAGAAVGTMHPPVGAPVGDKAANEATRQTWLAQNESQRVRDVNGTCVCVRGREAWPNCGEPWLRRTSGYDAADLAATHLAVAPAALAESEGENGPYIRRGPGSLRTCGLSPASNNWLAAVGIGPCDIVLHLWVSVWTLL